MREHDWTDLAPEFHAHLDTCERCRTQPMNLCPIGAGILSRESRKCAKWPATPESTDAR